VTAEAVGSGRTETPVQRLPNSAESKQPDRSAKQRQPIPNLKMSSPSAPGKNSAKFSEGSAPGMADATSGVPSGGAPSSAMLSPVMRSENQPAPPPIGSALPSANIGISNPTGKAVREPRLISSTNPAYPAMARQSNAQGIVVLSADVDAKGNVTRVTAVSGPVVLREAAIEAVKQWKYAPALIDGSAVGSQVSVQVQFRLK
jgi:protein TonB